jgi:hypothetical protein
MSTLGQARLDGGDDEEGEEGEEGGDEDGR